MASISIPTAVIAGATAVGSIASASIAGSAAKSAAKTEADAAAQAGQLQQQAADKAAAATAGQVATATGNLTPWIIAGQGALGEEQNLLGLTGPRGTVPAGGPDQAAIQATLSQTPGYQFTLDQGLKATQNSYAAQGLGSSGAAMKGAAQFATGLADQTYEQRLQDYLSVAGKGQDAATNLAQLAIGGTATAGNFSTSGAAAAGAGLVGAANATAAGTVGSANALTSGISGLTNAAVLGSLGTSGLFGTPSNQLGISQTAGATNAQLSQDLAGTALRPIATPKFNVTPKYNSSTDSISNTATNSLSLE